MSVSVKWEARRDSKDTSRSCEREASAPGLTGVSSPVRSMMGCVVRGSSTGDVLILFLAPSSAMSSRSRLSVGMCGRKAGVVQSMPS